MDSDEPQMNPTKIRIGLALISVVVIVAVVLAFVVDEPVGKSLMIVIAVIAAVRMFLLSRSLRRNPPAA